MTESPETIAPLYSGWHEYQQRLVKAVAPLTPEQLVLGVRPDMMPVGLLATHIIGVRAGWLYYVLEERDERLGEFTEWTVFDRPIRSAAELVRGLEGTWEVIHERLNRWTVADLADEFWDRDDDGKPVGPLTRQWVIWHLLEHDLHHGGELSLTLGMHGVPGIEL